MSNKPIVQKLAAGAYILKDGKVLTLKRTFPDVVYWAFPGGGVEEGETEVEAVERECFEETSVKIKVGKFYFKQIFRESINNFYLCEYVSGEALKGDGPEYSDTYSIYKGEHDPEWLEMRELEKYDLRPNELRDKIIIEFLHD